MKRRKKRENETEIKNESINNKVRKNDEMKTVKYTQSEIVKQILIGVY